MRPEHVWTIRMMLLHDGPVLRQSNTLGDVDKWTCLDPNDSPPQRDWQSNVCEPTVIQTNAWWDGIAAAAYGDASHASKRSLRSYGYGKCVVAYECDMLRHMIAYVCVSS